MSFLINDFIFFVYIYIYIYICKSEIGRSCGSSFLFFEEPLHCLFVVFLMIAILIGVR